MLKKLTLLAMSVGALLAFAAPASGAIIETEGKEGLTYIWATSTNTITHTSAGTLECTTVTVTLHLTQNSNETAKGHGTGWAEGTPKALPPTHSGHCGTSSGAVLEVTHVVVSDLHLTTHFGNVTGTATFSFTYDLRSATGAGLIAHCTFGTPNEKVTVTKVNTDTLKIHGNLTKTGGGAFCPHAGTITGDFTLEEHRANPNPIHIL